jgi:hypothetical protein
VAFPTWSDELYSLGQLAGLVTEGDLAAMARKLNSLDNGPRFDEHHPDRDAKVTLGRATDLHCLATDGEAHRRLGDLLRESILLIEIPGPTI